MGPTPRPIARAGIGVVVLMTLTAAAGCTGSGHGSAAGSSGASSAASGSSSPTNGRPVAAAINPLTGLKATRNPVVAVKIDDTGNGRPQVGVDEADIVYIKQVEGGLTRLIAVFSSRLPVVEPVRSTRADDPQLMMEYGPIDYVASGGDRAELAPLRRSTLRADLDGPTGVGFSRDPNRPVPFNLTANLRQIAKRTGGPAPRSIGLVWSRSLHRSGTSPGVHVRTTVGATPVAFDWNSKTQRYVRLINGAVQHTANGHVIATPNVIVQFCRSTVYRRDIDTAGNPAQWTHTVGTGKVVVFRDGRRIVGTWTRHAVKDGTTLRDGHGHPIALTPGGAWFVQVADGTRLA